MEEAEADELAYAEAKEEPEEADTEDKADTVEEAKADKLAADAVEEDQIVENNILVAQYYLFVKPVPILMQSTLSSRDSRRNTRQM
eukprot:CAMPEP_0172572264 /NCGR_PEP_ID=MMETSP1067-20121228/134479_1 /TAXON_ID=265564 ORGANISM="Thalassiosira punctigera, Strain Tpunct2005C2" /NCGR_SAMPLE_ID=MMETSP1067 /ASSEMBLY_ACC=CAM_ASM_000444 /LENGTH=85 /DNA_ID=CAMNT_0013364765 /DNA_START=445 /DNA_END=703 /DNA_ORIENTATION=+